jgi:NDP-sugar pyrophosphorylase family protein
MLPPPMTRDWARNLLAYEAVPSTASAPAEPAISLVYEKLRRQLGAPVGVDGFQALASRALKLASSEVPSLSAVRITADGSLSDLSVLKSQTGEDNQRENEAGVIFIAHLLGLFLTFLGPATTRGLVQDIFPYLEAPGESASSTPFEGVLQEVNNLRTVSNALEALANRHPAEESGLLTISENIRNIATILDVFAVVRNASETLRESVPTEQSTTYMM